MALTAARRGQLDTRAARPRHRRFDGDRLPVGQLFAWRELAASGYLLASNPANSFFYLITGMHGLHILGGLVGARPDDVQGMDGAIRPKGCALSVELCAMYWHFLLFVWLALFVLLAGWAADFIDICRQLLT